MEMLYRMKWAGKETLMLKVRDWRSGDTFGQLDISMKQSWTAIDGTDAKRVSIDRSLSFTDVGMMALGAEMPEPLDPKLMAQLPPLVQKQMEEGNKLRLKMANNPQFFGSEPGLVTMSINDRDWSRVADGCGPRLSSTKTLLGFVSGEFSKPSINELPNIFNVAVDIEKKTATLTVNSGLMVKYVVESKQGKIKSREEKQDMMGIFSGLELQEPYGSDKPIIIPLKETKVIDSNAMNYYGAISIPYHYGGSDQLKGVIQLSYSVTRKVVKAK
jgi:hypothetical protein